MGIPNTQDRIAATRFLYYNMDSVIFLSASQC